VSSPSTEGDAERVSVGDVIVALHIVGSRVIDEVAEESLALFLGHPACTEE